MSYMVGVMSGACPLEPDGLRRRERVAGLFCQLRHDEAGHERLGLGNLREGTIVL
jgi:hypothetical protein